jgi:HAD superfamily hydrolase (TIGR01490 family)
MSLALFDLDNTLITSDSDFLWGQYLVDHCIVDPSVYAEKNRQFFEDYEQGSLDIDQYLRFSLEPLTRFDPEQLYAWRADYVERMIKPLIAPGTPNLLARHRAAGDTLLIISATNLFITAPIADLLEVDHILATEPEFVAGRYTGDYLGIPTFQRGKVEALGKWLEAHGESLEDSWFYSDSHNDLPLLEQVDHPVAVNPDPTLAALAQQRGWTLIDLRGQ